MQRCAAWSASGPAAAAPAASHSAPAAVRPHGAQVCKRVNTRGLGLQSVAAVKTWVG